MLSGALTNFPQRWPDGAAENHGVARQNQTLHRNFESPTMLLQYKSYQYHSRVAIMSEAEV